VKKEWIELLVLKTDGVDLRNWRITDLGGPTASPSATEGVLTFPNASYLANIPQWTRIVVVLRTPDANPNEFQQDTVATDGTLVLFTVGIPGGVLDSTRTMDLSLTDNCVLVDGSLTAGTVIDIVSWGGSITGWPAGMWSNDLTVSAGNGAYFTNAPDTCSGNNDNGLSGWLSNVPAANLTPGFINTGQRYPVPPDGRRWIGTSGSWTNPSNWCPPGVPDGMNIIIGSSPSPAILTSSTMILSLRILRGAKLRVEPPGILNVIGSIIVEDSMKMSSTLPATIGGKVTITDSGVVTMDAPVIIATIGGDFALNGKLLIGGSVSADISCGGSWLPGPNSSFIAGSSTFHFGNRNRPIDIDRGAFFNLVIDTAQQVNITGDVVVSNTLVLRDSVSSIAQGKVLSIANRAPGAIVYSPTGGIMRGTVIRSIDTTATAVAYAFHNPMTVARFDSGAPARSVAIGEEPDSALGGYPLLFTKKIYDISGQSRGAFRGRLCLHYNEEDLRPGVVESQLRLWRTTNDGVTWIYESGTVDTINNVVCVDSARGFSKWSWGIPLRPPTVVERASGLLPTSFRLEQNYPNPFNPVTTIRYALPARSYVTLRVFDVLGRLISVLTEGQQEPGSHEAKWNAERCSSGVYFYRLQAGSHSETRKMVLLR